MDFFTSDMLIALLTLLALEIILGIDNVIFIAIVAGKLPEGQRARARNLGIALAVITRLLLLLGITWIMQLTEPLITVMGKSLSGRDMILLFGGMFLIGKSTYEIHEKLEVAEAGHEHSVTASTMAGVLLQIIIIDMVFSLDSVITAVGLSGDLFVMATAIILSAGVMLFFAGVISDFVERHPTMKMLALSFLILIGSLLVIEGWNPELVEHYNLRYYAYFAMFFSFIVELLNMRIRGRPEPVKLHRSHLPEDAREG